ncbi:hypothetical protein PHLGIDRAFT_338039 [Phlebiopsis gigantea 11061_1 CR5-6]|uniref:Uncharacterized protein n=1 Tax=Phlebiopsis gigantea (strain 11061_1 CR5-6) TaxID=745531 RepID=A0A0C3SCZ0_PHLG1|nr:hypothetical protein PHLGIDRAFT_338039 [Phlebiopsis gigantea 11061_1 CR5-6]
MVLGQKPHIHDSACVLPPRCPSSSVSGSTSSSSSFVSVSPSAPSSPNSPTPSPTSGTGLSSTTSGMAPAATSGTTKSYSTTNTTNSTPEPPPSTKDSGLPGSDTSGDSMSVPSTSSKSASSISSQSSSTTYSVSSTRPPLVASSTNTSINSRTSTTSVPTPSLIISGQSTLHRSIRPGAIAGGVIGGIVLALLITFIFFSWRSIMKYIHHLRNRRVAPSSEFLDPTSRFYADRPAHAAAISASPSPFLVHRRSPSTLTMGGILRQHPDAQIDDDQPPPFAPGAFRDPVIEKVSAAAMQQALYLMSVESSDEGHGSQSSGVYSRSSLRDDSSVSQSPSVEGKQYLVDATDLPVTSSVLRSQGNDFLGSCSDVNLRLSEMLEGEVGWAR